MLIKKISTRRRFQVQALAALLTQTDTLKLFYNYMAVKILQRYYLLLKTAQAFYLVAKYAPLHEIQHITVGSCRQSWYHKSYAGIRSSSLHRHWGLAARICQRWCLIMYNSPAGAIIRSVYPKLWRYSVWKTAPGNKGSIRQNNRLRQLDVHPVPIVAVVKCEHGGGAAVPHAIDVIVVLPHTSNALSLAIKDKPLWIKCSRSIEWRCCYSVHAVTIRLSWYRYAPGCNGSDWIYGAAYQSRRTESRDRSGRIFLYVCAYIRMYYVLTIVLIRPVIPVSCYFRAISEIWGSLGLALITYMISADWWRSWKFYFEKR